MRVFLAWYQSERLKVLVQLVTQAPYREGANWIPRIVSFAYSKSLCTEVTQGVRPPKQSMSCRIRRENASRKVRNYSENQSEGLFGLSSGGLGSTSSSRARGRLDMLDLAESGNNAVEESAPVRPQYRRL